MRNEIRSSDPAEVIESAILLPSEVDKFVRKLFQEFTVEFSKQLGRPVERLRGVNNASNSIGWKNPATGELESLRVAAYSAPDDWDRSTPLVIRVSVNCFSAWPAQALLRRLCITSAGIVRGQRELRFYSKCQLEFSCLPQELADFPATIAAWVKTMESPSGDRPKVFNYSKSPFMNRSRRHEYLWTDSAAEIYDAWQAVSNARREARIQSRRAARQTKTADQPGANASCEATPDAAPGKSTGLMFVPINRISAEHWRRTGF